MLQSELKLQEKWADAGQTTHPSRAGMFKGKTIADLKKMKEPLVGKQPYTKADRTKMAQLNFAIRAKQAKGGKWGPIK